MQIFGEIPFIKSQKDLLKCSYSPSVQWHALTSVHMLSIPSIGSHTNILKGTAYTRSTFGDGVQMPKLQGIENHYKCSLFYKTIAEEELCVSKNPVFQPLDIIYCNNLDSNAQSRYQYSESVNPNWTPNHDFNQKHYNL